MLLQLTGSKEVKTSEQSLPRPLRLTLHPESDFRDLTYMARQVYSFSYLSWRSSLPRSPIRASSPMRSEISGAELQQNVLDRRAAAQLNVVPLNAAEMLEAKLAALQAVVSGSSPLASRPRRLRPSHPAGSSALCSLKFESRFAAASLPVATGPLAIKMNYLCHRQAGIACGV